MKVHFFWRPNAGLIALEFGDYCLHLLPWFAHWDLPWGWERCGLHGGLDCWCFCGGPLFVLMYGKRCSDQEKVG